MGQKVTTTRYRFSIVEVLDALELSSLGITVANFVSIQPDTVNPSYLEITVNDSTETVEDLP